MHSIENIYRLRYPDPGYRIFNRVISDIPVVLRETTLTISDSFEAGSPIETEIVRVVSLCTSEITQTVRFRKRSSGSGSPIPTQ